MRDARGQTLQTADGAVDWLISTDPVDYPAAVGAMEARVGAIHRGEAGDAVWLLEHSALYTAGTSADPSELLLPGRLPVYETGRGGRYTYHGPGQRVAYVMMDLRPRGNDLRAYVRTLEDWVITALVGLGVVGERRPDRIGIWVAASDGSEAKIAALGVRIRRWVAFHGVAINVDPDLSDFAGIVPCGIEGYGVTSLKELGIDATMNDLDEALRTAFAAVFKRSLNHPMAATPAIQ
jgi:lipoyl(octanoyl) transferase